MIKSTLENAYYDIVKEYPDMYRLVAYKFPYIVQKTGGKKKKNETVVSVDSGSLDFSVRRTRRTIHDYARCNDFDLFVTFTFNPKKVNRYDVDACYSKMQGWLWRQHRKRKDFGYVIVPEKHKDGAIHFHAIMRNYPFLLKVTNVVQDSRRVHNIPGFRFGFTNATFISGSSDDHTKVANYICKYITKDMILVHNKRRYWCSRGLQKPVMWYNRMYDFGLHNYMTHDYSVAESDFNVVYEIPKDLLV